MNGMFQWCKHPSDRQIICHIAGELPARMESKVRAHLENCETCRARGDELSRTMRQFEDVWRERDTSDLSSDVNARNLLRLRMAQLSLDGESAAADGWLTSGRKLVFATAAVCGSLALGILIGRAFEQTAQRPEFVRSVPDSRLTPGATMVADRQAVCSGANVKNKSVPIVLQRQVFQEYGIVSAAPKAYEVDYLVTPALGGAEDIRNLSPQSFSADWNARVKDDLEDRLRDMVCSGEIELAQAQQEIARDWIVAYKKYFHTNRPLPSR